MRNLSLERVLLTDNSELISGSTLFCVDPDSSKIYGVNDRAEIFSLDSSNRVVSSTYPALLPLALIVFMSHLDCQMR